MRSRFSGLWPYQQILITQFIYSAYIYEYLIHFVSAETDSCEKALTQEICDCTEETDEYQNCLVREMKALTVAHIREEGWREDEGDI